MMLCAACSSGGSQGQLGTTSAGDDESGARTSGHDASSSEATTVAQTGSTSASEGSADEGSSGSESGGPCIGCPPCDGSTEASPLEQTLLELPADTWVQAPNTNMREVCPPNPDFGDCRNVVAAWSSGAYDPVHRRMLIWGGGHADYSGNELYAFDLPSGTWSLLTQPSMVPEGTPLNDFYNRDPLPDGQPVGRHSYDGVEFLPDLDLLFAHGGSRAGDGFGAGVTWVYDSTSGWSQPVSEGNTGPNGVLFAMAYDETGGQVALFSSEYLWMYDVSTRTWAGVDGFGFPPLWPRYGFSGDKTAVIDPSRRLLWVVGGHGYRQPGAEPIGGHGNVFVWDLAAGEAVTDDWVTVGGGEFDNSTFINTEVHPDQAFQSGGGDVYNVMAPGIDYDAATDSFVAWPNAGSPYILDLQTKVWRTGAAEGAPTTASTSGGTYGRWRYIAAYNVFILVNSVDEDVYFYKHTAGCGPT